MVQRKRSRKANGARNGLTRSEFLRALRDTRKEIAEGLGDTRREVAEEISEVRREIAQGFADAAARFEAMDRRFEVVNRRFEVMDTRFEGLRDWVSLVVGHLQTRVGRRLEDTVAGALRLALGMYDIAPGQIRLRQKIVDADGRIGPAGREYEFDILAKDGETYVFEVKSALEVEDVVRFNDKADLAIASLRPARWKKVLVTLDKDAEVLRKADELGILVV